MIRRKKYLFNKGVRRDSVPVIPVRVSGDKQIYLAVIDTGSEISIIDSNYVNIIDDNVKMHIENDKDVSIQGATGHPNDTTKRCVGSVEIQDVDGHWNTHTVDCIALDMEPLQEGFRSMHCKSRVIILLGIDWLHEREAKIDVKRKMLTANTITNE